MAAVTTRCLYILDDSKKLSYHLLESSGRTVDIGVCCVQGTPRILDLFPLRPQIQQNVISLRLSLQRNPVGLLQSP